MLDESLAPPPLDETLSVSERLQAVVSVMAQTKVRDSGKSTTKVSLGIKEQFKALSSTCGVFTNGKFEDPQVACWLLDPGGKQKNLHRMVTNLLPQEAHLLDCKYCCKTIPVHLYF